MAGRIGQREAAQWAYEGFADRLGWMTIEGGMMPPWERLPERMQQAWRAGVQRAFQKGWLDAAPAPRR